MSDPDVSCFMCLVHAVIQVKEVLFHERSAFQDVLVFEAVHYGKVLVLDGVIQLTERDEFSYQEMLAHIPCFAHGSPKKARLQLLSLFGNLNWPLKIFERHQSRVQPT